MKNFPVRFLLVIVGGAAILVDWLVGLVYVEGIGGSGLVPGCGDVEKKRGLLYTTSEGLSVIFTLTEWYTGKGDRKSVV